MRAATACLLALGLMLPIGSPRSAMPALEGTVLTMRVNGDIVVDEAGRLVSYTRSTPLPDALAARLDAQVKGWQFDLSDTPRPGQRIPAKMRITLVAHETSEGGHEVQVDNVVFPSGAQETRVGTQQAFDDEGVNLTVEKLGGVRYPRWLEGAGVEALVLLSVRIGPDGKVSDAVVSQTSLFNVRGQANDLRKAIAAFEQATLQGTKAWRFKLEARDANVPVQPVDALVPVLYVFDTPKDTGTWRTEVRGPKRRAPWAVDDRSADVGSSDVGDGAVLRTSDRIRLATNARGVVL